MLPYDVLQTACYALFCSPLATIFFYSGMNSLIVCHYLGVYFFKFRVGRIFQLTLVLLLFLLFYFLIVLKVIFSSKAFIILFFLQEVLSNFFDLALLLFF